MGMPSAIAREAGEALNHSLSWTGGPINAEVKGPVNLDHNLKTWRGLGCLCAFRLQLQVRLIPSATRRNPRAIDVIYR